VLLSHEGTTPTTLAAARAFPGERWLVTGARESELATVCCNVVVCTPAVEESWCHTASYTCAVAALAALRGEDVSRLPDAVADALAAERLPVSAHERWLVAGSGEAWPTAQEAVLKLREGCFVAAEAHHTEQLLHGQLAAVDESVRAFVYDGPRAADAVAALREHLGLDKPFAVRYLEYVGRLARGDLGRSIQQNRPVAAELADAWPATLQLTIAALVIAAAVGVVAGVVSAVWPNSIFDAVARLASLFGLSMPIFWTGLVLIVVFSLWLNWLPVGGAGSLSHLVLPAVTLALPSVAMVSRMTRSAVLDVLREDYVRTARAKGVGEWWVLGKHALRNAFIPILTLLGLQSGQLMGGAVLTETVFAWPGLGRLMVKAIFARDYVLLQGAVLVFALAFVVINLLVDLSYGLLDPRVGRQG
jgi:ABC-type dipeptide/oligopeptide/nickel transport system permease component